MSFASTNGDNDRFKAMFPDSKIAKSYSQSETKPNCPFKNQILDAIRFDETTTAQTKKPDDGYLSCFSKKFNIVTTVYLGSLFVGHCEPNWHIFVITWASLIWTQICWWALAWMDPVSIRPWVKTGQPSSKHGRKLLHYHFFGFFRTPFCW